MNIKKQTLFYVLLGFFAALLLYLDRSILTPFILAGIFAYIFNPVVNFFSHIFRVPRSLSIFIVYVITMGAIIILGITLTSRILAESTELTHFIDSLTKGAEAQIDALPDWMQPIVKDSIQSLESTKVFTASSLFVLFPQALSKILSFFIFLFSGFYFLKEGRRMIDKIVLVFPKNSRVDIEIILRRMNTIFSGYLRGQLFLIGFVSLILFVALSILGIRFSLILAIFSGFAEIIPFIGPLIATVVAVLVVLVTQTAHFSLDPLSASLIVIAVYFVVRQFQDYFVTPHVMGKITKIHPFVIFFAVLSGGHLFGILGYVLAVPLVGSLKIILEFFHDKMGEVKMS